MEYYQGVILVRMQNTGSKSEGHYAFLVRDDDMNVLKLCREGVQPVDDLFFARYDRLEVVVTGRMSHGWLVVETVEEIANGETAENRNSDEEMS